MVQEDRRKLQGNGGQGTASDLAMMRSPGDWPRWPWLPLKRVSRELSKGQWDQFAVLHCTAVKAEQDGKRFPVYINPVGAAAKQGDGEAAKKARRSSNPKKQHPTEMEKIEYRSLDEVVADGWHVD